MINSKVFLILLSLGALLICGVTGSPCDTHASGDWCFGTGYEERGGERGVGERVRE